MGRRLFIEPHVRSLPGAGPVMAPSLAAAMGTRRELFASASELAAMTGIAPVQHCSGQSRWIHVRWAVPSSFARLFTSGPATPSPNPARPKLFTDRQIAKGKGHHAALRALAFKGQIRCWKDRCPYDEQKYTEALRRRGSPLVAALQ